MLDKRLDAHFPIYSSFLLLLSLKGDGIVQGDIDSVDILAPSA